MSLDIGLVGVGPWGRHVLRDLRSLGANVHTVARSAASIERAKAGGAASIVDAPAKLPECAAYVIANRTLSHLDAIEDLLPRGKPMFVEKPIATDVARVKRLPQTAHNLICVMHKWRYHPGILELKRIAESGEYGPVLGLRSFRLGWGNPHKDVSALWILAPHDLSIALEILGEVPRLIAAAPDPTDQEGGGALAHLETRARVPFTMELSAGHPARLRRVLLRCRDAVCQLDDSAYAQISIHKIGADEPIIVPVSDEMPLLAELRAFLDHVRGGPAPVTGLAEEIKVIELIAQIEAAIAR